MLLPYRPRHLWHTLFARRDEFHPSLNFNSFLYEKFNLGDRKKYVDDLIKRRNAAHDADLKRDV